MALLVDNSSFNGNLETIPKLCNIEVVYLSANTTSLLQPQNAGIISVVKRRYRKCQVMKVLNLNEQDYDSIYGVDRIAAMTWVQNISLLLESTIVHNSWGKTGLIEISSAGSNLFQNTIIREENKLLNHIYSILPVSQKLVIEIFTQPPGEDLATTGEGHLE